MKNKIKNKKAIAKNELLNEALTEARAAFNEDISNSNEELVNNPLYDIMDDEDLFSDLFIEDFIIE
ncbi:MAG: hypothetical protein HRT69_11785 [Flavobacteriaceae bacterium]|nr:hypothetical protein [Flavobacteriaceae bacterium]